MESTQSYRVGLIPLKRRPTPRLTLFAGLSTEGRVESSQSYRVAWSVLIRGCSLYGIVVGRRTGGRVESTQSYRVG